MIVGRVARFFTRRAGPATAVRALLAISLATAAVAVACGGGDDGGTPVPRTPAATATPGANIGLKTPIPISPGDELTAQDLAARGAGLPGRGTFVSERLIIPKIGVDAPLTYRTVGGDGQMPNPKSWDDVAYYDFGAWPGLGGLPGKGGNVVLAGHVDYIRHGPAVFWDLSKLAAGDRAQIRQNDGTLIEYEIVFNKHVEVGDADWTAIVAGTSPESITLITCGGEFSAGHYSDRQVVWGRRVEA